MEIASCRWPRLAWRMRLVLSDSKVIEEEEEVSWRLGASAGEGEEKERLIIIISLPVYETRKIRECVYIIKKVPHAHGM